MVDFKITQNDLYPAISGVCKDDDGNLVDLTGASVKFHMKEPGSDVVKVNANGSVIGSETDGRVAYQWEVGDTDTSGNFQGEFEVTHSDGKPETFPSDPLEIYIRPEIA